MLWKISPKKKEDELAKTNIVFDPETGKFIEMDSKKPISSDFDWSGLMPSHLGYYSKKNGKLEKIILPAFEHYPRAGIMIHALGQKLRSRL